MPSTVFGIFTEFPFIGKSVITNLQSFHPTCKVVSQDQWLSCDQLGHGLEQMSIHHEKEFHTSTVTDVLKYED